MPRRKKAPELTFQQHIADYLVREHRYGVLEQSGITDFVAHGDIGQKYLADHSAGSGKTLSICWLADRLHSLFKPGTNHKLVALQNVAFQDDGLIQYKAEVMLRMFEKDIQPLVGGRAKAMIVTSSRVAGLRYFEIIKEKPEGFRQVPERHVVRTGRTRSRDLPEAARGDSGGRRVCAAGRGGLGEAASDQHGRANAIPGKRAAGLLSGEGHGLGRPPAVRLLAGQVREPSPTDVEITGQLKAAGEIVGIDLLDHIIFNGKIE